MRDSWIVAVKDVARKYKVSLSDSSESRIKSYLRQTPPNIDAIVGEFHSRSILSDTDRRHAREDLEKVIK